MTDGTRIKVYFRDAPGYPMRLVERGFHHEITEAMIRQSHETAGKKIASRSDEWNKKNVQTMWFPCGGGNELLACRVARGRNGLFFLIDQIPPSELRVDPGNTGAIEGMPMAFARHLLHTEQPGRDAFMAAGFLARNVKGHPLAVWSFRAWAEQIFERALRDTGGATLQFPLPAKQRTRPPEQVAGVHGDIVKAALVAGVRLPDGPFQMTIGGPNGPQVNFGQTTRGMGGMGET